MEATNDAVPGDTADPPEHSTVEVSVIIPVLDHRVGLGRCLASLARQQMPLDMFEVIVVDNGPEEGVAERLTDLMDLLACLPNAHALHQPQPGSYAARNLGLSIATAKILAFTDDDCLPQTDWLVTGVSFLREHPDVDAVAGAVDIFPYTDESRTGAELFELRHGFQQAAYVETAGFGATANLFARKSAFDKVGTFDDSLRSGGDKEWGYRLKLNGLQMVYEPTARVRHPARRTLGALRSKIHRVVEGDIVLRRRLGWSRLNWLWYSMQVLRPPLRTIWRARQDESLRSWSEWWRYGVTFIAVRWITAYTRIRRLRRWPAT